MAYTTHNFQDGDILTAQALNEMEVQISANTTKLETLGEVTLNFTSDYQTELNRVINFGC